MLRATPSSSTSLATAGSGPGDAAPLVVVNPHAHGVRDAAATCQELERAFAAVGRPAEVVVTTGLDDLRAQLAAASSRRVVLVGGDGTLHAVANSGRLPVELALVPLGTAGNVAASLAIPRRLGDAVALAAHGAARALDAIELTTPHGRQIVVEGVSVGFHAAARARYHARGSAHPVIALRAFARTLAQRPRFALALALDGEPVREPAVSQLFLATLPRYAFGLRVNPGADVADGVAEAIALPPLPRRTAPRLVAALRRGDHLAWPGVERRPWRRAELTLAAPVAADATPLGATTFSARVLPGHLRIVAGDPFAAATRPAADGRVAASATGRAATGGGHAPADTEPPR